MNYWLINPNKDGVGTNTSNLSNDVVYMGWDSEDCPQFYKGVKPGDVIIICEKAHYNNLCHCVGVAERLDKNEKCWHLRFSTPNWNDEISKCIRNAPSDFSGGNSKNPWGSTKSIICLGDNPAERQIKEMVKEIIQEMKIDELKGLLESDHNIILHGAPGTGKTYTAKEIAKIMNAECDFVQFHPSYDYTDFVEGLRPFKKSASNEIGFERRDGVFKAFCNKAEKEKDKKFVFVIDEINRGDMSKIFGELFFSIDPGYRGKDKGLVKTQYQNLIEKGDVFEDGFFVPENVYIIGTMNDIDRSVESMDFAMRRRFTFCEIKAKDSQVMLTVETFKKILDKEADKDAKLNKCTTELENLKAKMDKLNEKIISRDIGLSEDYQIGAAYFLKFAQYANETKPFDGLWKYHLENVLREYLRGTGNEDKLSELEKAYKNEPSYANDQSSQK